MTPFSHQHAARPTHLLLAGVLSLVLAACGGESSETLISQAKASIAKGDTNAAVIQLKNAITADEKNSEARFQLGALYLESGDWASAEKEFRRAREAGYPANTVNPMIARALLGQREYQRVLDELPAPTDISQGTATMHALHATAALGLGRKEDARKELLKVVQAAPDDVDVQLALARLGLADNDVGKAQQALEHALHVNPRHRDSLLLKADLLRATRKPTEAAAVYRDILKFDPRHTGARLALADIAIADNNLDEARKEVNTALKTSPGNLQARYTLSLIDFREQKTEQARDHLAAVLKSAPEYVPALLLGGSIEYQLGNLQTAEAHLNKVVKAVPGNLYAIRLLAASQLRLGRPDDAARTLAPALQSGNSDAGVLVVAGEIALAKKDYSQASSYFEKAAQRSPDSAAIRTELGISRLALGDNRAMADLQLAAGMEGANSRADTFIILNQLKNKQFDAALTSIAALEKKQPASPLSWNYRGAAYLGKQDIPHARDSFSQALKIDPGFFPAAANLAQLDLKDKQPNAARQRFEGILKTDPKHLNAMLALADLALRNKDEKSYVGWLEKAAAAQPKAVQPRIGLTRYQLAKGEKNKALATAREAYNAQPDDPVALDLLATTQLALGDTANALANFQKLVERQSGQVAPLIKLANAQIVSKDVASARTSLQEALRILPDSIDAQLMLGGVEIQAAHFDEALKFARKVQQQSPQNPAGFVLEGDAAFARKDFPVALAAFERAQKLNPSGAVLARQLRVFTATQHPEEGEKRLIAWLAAHPQDTSIRATLAESLINRKQYKAAIEHYLILNKSNPNNLLVLNNLAWSLSESRDNRALEFAEKALKLQPENPAVLDTLGWILVQQGQAARGIRLLQQALSKAPDAGEIQFHLASAYAQSGDRTRAQGELERLLSSGTPFPQEQEARTLLGQLKNKTR